MQGKGKAHAKKNAKVGIKMVCGEEGQKRLLGITRVENYFLDHIKMKLGRKFMWGLMENKMGKDDREY